MVAEEQLALYCRGNQASFSARIVVTQSSKGNQVLVQGVLYLEFLNFCIIIHTVCISSWCFYGNEEWKAILKRIDSDMKYKIN